MRQYTEHIIQTGRYTRGNTHFDKNNRGILQAIQIAVYFQGKNASIPILHKFYPLVNLLSTYVKFGKFARNRKDNPFTDICDSVGGSLQVMGGPQ